MEKSVRISLNFSQRVSLRILEGRLASWIIFCSTKNTVVGCWFISSHFLLRSGWFSFLWENHLFRRRTERFEYLFFTPINTCRMIESIIFIFLQFQCGRRCNHYISLSETSSYSSMFSVECIFALTKSSISLAIVSDFHATTVSHTHYATLPDPWHVIHC